MKPIYSHRISSIILVLGLLFGYLNTYAETDCSAVTEISQIECESLLQLYHSTDGTNWRKNYGWNITNTPCDWHGITCDLNGVVKIEFDKGYYHNNNRLVGTIPNFTGLPHLERLFLQDNQLTGEIPDFSGLPNLQILSLGSNQLTGKIPDFKGLPHLQSLLLYDNQLTGAIPDFSHLPNLQLLFLNNNLLTGAIPNFSDLPNLQSLFLHNNQLTGEIPDLSHLSHLQSLFLYNNQLAGGNQPMIITDCRAVTEISQVECESLLDIYHSTNGPNWIYNHGWNTNNTPCSWYGITCENHSVVEIDLIRNHLSGPIPNFRGLPNLQRIYLWSNQLKGELPDFSGLPNLQELYLSNNQLIGEIPNFSGLPNLQALSLSDNQLKGQIPNFHDLPNLTYLEVEGNQLTGTTDCSAVKGISQVECESLLQLYHSTNGAYWENNEGWNITNTPCAWYGITCENHGVVKIDLEGSFGNDLIGNIPDFKSLPNLQTLILSWDRELTGPIPDFSGLPNLEKLDLGTNGLTGSIPDFSGLPNLKWLNLEENKLTGSIPDFSGLPNLEWLNLDHNDLSGAIPNFSHLPNLESFEHRWNKLTEKPTDCSAVSRISQMECESLLQLYHSTNGPNWTFKYGWNVTNIPCTWRGITCENNSVVEIKLVNIYMMGPIPHLKNLPNLHTLDLHWNQLTGPLPDFSDLPNLQVLNLARNPLTGPLPDFSDLPHLIHLYIEGEVTGVTDCNAVKGVSQEECESLLQLYHNIDGVNWTLNSGWNITNTPCSWHGITCENNGITEISLRYHRMTGQIPNFTSLPNLEKLDLSGNQLTGPIPNFTGLPSLQTLELNDNQLTGKIPDFSSLLNLQAFNLSNNQLIGEIPDFSGLPNLQTFDLSNNQLTGEIPDFSELANLQKLNLRGNQLIENGIDCRAVKGVSQVECESLLQLYHRTNGPNWDNNDNWNITNTPCNWYGITCNSNGIVSISLSEYVYDYDFDELPLYRSNNLVGTIPDFSGLPHLQSLDLKDNQLTGTIPNFSGLPNLQTLTLENNQLTGAIPNFSDMPYLRELSLNGNQLTGAIPDFSAMPNLQSLDLKYNQLIGAIPDFSSLPYLRALYLNHNQLTGQIPDFNALPNLQSLDLSANQLTGELPNFHSVPNLQTLSMSENQLTGPIPDFTGLPNIQRLYLKGNQLTLVVQILLEKESYHLSEHFKAKLLETFNEDYDLYVAVFLPNGTDFMTLEDTNQFVPLNKILKWSYLRKQNEPIMLMDLTLPEDLTLGQYCLYGILSPQKESVLEVAEQWMMDSQCVEINSTN